jgi:hypothetical protein
MDVLWRPRNHAAALALLALTAACASPSVGQGPIQLTPRTEQALQRYMALASPEVFAVTEDGAFSSAVYCPETACRGNEVHLALERCRLDGRRCYVYAMGRQVVWRKDLPFRGP